MDVNLLPLLPAAQVLLTALVVMLLDLFLKENEKGLLAWIGLLGLVLCGVETVLLWGSQDGAFGDTLLLDNFALFFTQIFLGAAGLTILASIHYVRETRIYEGEFYALILFATVGMIVMAAANDLIVFFLGLETMSVAVYILTGMWRASSRSSEAAMKYFLMGAFATGFLLYGIALIYGATGSTNLNEISAHLVEPMTERPLYLAGGVLLLLIGFAFKVGAVPFHFWIPDVYEGAPTPVTGFMSVAVKAAAFAAWVRILMHKLSPFDSDWDAPLWLMAIATMTVGNLLALSQVERQTDARLFEHRPCRISTHRTGCGRGVGRTAAAVLFGKLCIYDRRCLRRARQSDGPDGPRDNYSDFAGLGFKRPFLAAAMSLFMLSLAGFPPLAGFTGKFYIFRSAILAGHTNLAIIGVLNSLLSVIYYLRVVVAMYMEEGGADRKKLSPVAVPLHCRDTGGVWNGLSGSYSSQGPRVEPDFFFLPRLVSRG